MKVYRILLGLLCGALAVYPLAAKERARRQAMRALALLEAAPVAWRGDDMLSLRVDRLGPLLASWQTVGGCGAGGSTGTGAGVKWIGRSTTGGLFQTIVQGNYVHFSDGYNFILSTQMTRDFTDKWNLGISIPYIYKYYSNLFQVADVSNAGLGDISLLATRRLGPTNATSLTGILGVPTGSYTAEYMNSQLTPDKQLGFGRFTGTLILDHVIDEDWGLVVLGGAAAYRGGTNSLHNYRAPNASVYGYTGYFWGPLVPVLGLNLTGFSKEDSRGSFGDTLNAPVAIAALNASVEWSNPYVALLAGLSVPFALRGETWGASGGFALQPWILALGLSVSPF